MCALKPITAVIWRKAEYTLDKTSVRPRTAAAHERNTHTHCCGQCKTTSWSKCVMWEFWKQLKENTQEEHTSPTMNEIFYNEPHSVFTLILKVNSYKFTHSDMQQFSCSSFNCQLTEN